ncbi:hypothetical protein QP932_11060 [Corynebacterium freneyi]|uniref:DUF6542 domain-containing protein n=1 Tax=Corynebacterium freneyi TaxID=134034 RepID=UPI00254E9E0C|nr:DUF6542 domain-containing protein [Corynebacterium freneyi]MDK8769025.1 hypothetical protein [Corynebacterium freneyi]
MSDTSTRANPNANRRSGPWRLPIWAPPLLILLAGLIGILGGLPTGNIGLPYLLAFAAAAIVGTALVDPRGLVVTVAQQPLLFTIVTPVVAWFIASWSDPSVGGATGSTPTKTRLITAAYPIVQYFPWMALIPLICTAIAIWRYLDITRVNAKTDKETRRENARVHKAEEATTVSATRARKRVAESDARVRHARGKGPSRRPASEIIQAAEERRRRAAERARAAQEARREQEAAPAPAAERRGPARPTDQGAEQPERPVRRRDPRAEQRMMEQRAAAGRPSPRRADERRTDGRRIDERRVADRRAAANAGRRDIQRDARRGEDPRRVRRDARDDRGVREYRFDDRRPAPRDDRRGAPRDDRRMAPRRDDVRRDDARRDDARRDDRYRDGGRYDGRREAHPERRRVREWPPRHERPRHSRDDLRRD